MKQTDRPRYIQEAESKYHETAAKLTGIKDIVAAMNANAVLTNSEPVSLLINQAETQLATVRERLAQLKHADDASWQSNKRHLESGWEGLLSSIKSLVARIH